MRIAGNLIVFMAVLLFASCHKSWTCTLSGHINSITAIKGTDTIINDAMTGTGSGFDDNSSYCKGLIVYYTNNGYYLIVDSSTIVEAGVVDKSSLHALEDNGFICTPK